MIFSGLCGAQAQFMKKLKEKVNTAVNGNGGASSNNTSSSASSSQANTIDLKKYNISSTPLYDPSAIKEAHSQLYETGTDYYVSENGILPRAVVFATNASQGEADHYEDNSVAYLFDNGKVTATKTAGDVRQDPSFQKRYTHDDWPYTTSSNMSPSQQGFNVHGKTFTGYDMAMTAMINKDETRYYIIGGKFGGDDVTYYLVPSEGKPVKLPGAAAGILVNSSFSSAAAYGFVNRLDDEQKKTGNVMTAAGNVLNQSDLYFADGRVVKNASNVSNGWLDRGGKNVFMSDPQQGTFLNGKKIADAYTDQGNAWCTSDGSSWAYYVPSSGNNAMGMNNLVFSDGTRVPLARHPRQMAYNGKLYMVWTQLTNGYDGTWIMCTKEM